MGVSMFWSPYTDIAYLCHCGNCDCLVLSNAGKGSRRNSGRTILILSSFNERNKFTCTCIYYNDAFLSVVCPYPRRGNSYCWDHGTCQLQIIWVRFWNTIGVFWVWILGEGLLKYPRDQAVIYTCVYYESETWLDFHQDPWTLAVGKCELEWTRNLHVET